MVAKSSCNEPKSNKIPFTKFYKFGPFPKSHFTIKKGPDVFHLSDYYSSEVVLSTDVFSLLVQRLVPEI